MGEGKHLKVVLDTNILISVLLFGKKLEPIREAWKKGFIKLIFCSETLEEFVKVLHYPKFGLSDEEIVYLVEEEVLPYAVVIDKKISLDPSLIGDKDDIKFLECALSGQADYLVSGDKEVLKLKQFENLQIISANEFLRKLNQIGKS